MCLFKYNISLDSFHFSSPKPKAVICRPSSSTMLKHLLLRNHLADQSQILCGASLERGNEILFAASGPHDQDGCHVHNAQKSSSPEPAGGFPRNLVCSIGDSSPS